MAATDLSSILDQARASLDAMSVRRAFGEAYEVGDTTVIPVAAVRGGVGGGGGSGTGPHETGTGSGGGYGTGLSVRPLGVFVVRDGDVRWQPAIDTLRVILGAQLVALAAVLTGRRLLRRRWGRHRH